MNEPLAKPALAPANLPLRENGKSLYSTRLSRPSGWILISPNRLLRVGPSGPALFCYLRAPTPTRAKKCNKNMVLYKSERMIKIVETAPAADPRLIVKPGLSPRVAGIVEPVIESLGYRLVR